MTSLLKKFSLLMIRAYQKTVSFDHGWLSFFYPNGYCKYYPSCSEYAARAIDKRGVYKGFLLATKRVIRCNPWSQGGIDDIQ